MEIKSNKIKTVIKLAIPLLIIISISLYLQINVISHPQRVTSWLSSFGPSIIFVYIVIQSLAIIIPPIPGSLVSIPMLALLGPLKGLALIYLVVTPAECVNFIIAKKYGRSVVTKLVGKKSMEKIDQYTKNASFGHLIVLKLLADSYFDYVSYGLGLTNITIPQFIFVNFVFGLVRAALSYYVLTKAPNFTSSILLLELTAGILTGGYLLFRHWHHKKMALPQKLDEL